MKRPSWDDAPDWARYLAQNENGHWRWMESEPYPSYETDTWIGCGEHTDAYIHMRRWEKTLETRPSVTRDQALNRIIAILGELKTLVKAYCRR